MINNKKFLLFFIFVFTLCMLLPAVSANNNTIYVSPDAGDDGDGSMSNPYNSISKALGDVSAEKKTIVLENGTYFENNINIVKSVNIIGVDDAVVDGGNRAILFKISNTSTVIMANLTLKNAFSNSVGAAVINNGNLCVDKVSFINNMARSSSAIDNSGNLLVINSYFEANRAIGRDGGAITNMGNTVVINSTFINNTAARNGGAIKHQGNRFSVTNSTFIGNDAFGFDNYGGAIYIWASKAQITNSIFKSNIGGYGGAVFISGGNLESTALNVTRCVFEDNYGRGGSDLEIDDGVVNVTYSKILDGVAVLKTSQVYLDYNWWGVNEPDFSEIVTSPKPDIYATLKVRNNKNTVKTGVYWVNSSQIVSEIPQMIGNIKINSTLIDDVDFSREYEFNLSENSTVRACLDREVQNLTVRSQIKTVLTAEDIEMYYHDGTRYRVVLTDIDGNPLANQSVMIRINGVEYNRTTNVSGGASIGLNLDSATYAVDVVYISQLENYLSCNTTSKVNILPTVKGNDVVKVFRNDTQYYATFRNFNGTYLASGSVVLFNINGVLYDRTVRENGVAKLNLNLEAGEYILTAQNTVTGEMSSNNIIILSKFSENKDLVKYYKNDSQYTVKLIGNDGNAVGAGENVTFNINGVFYTRTTNASGIAKLNINLNPGTYIITAEYAGCRVANNITVLPVLSASDISMSYRDGTPFKANLLNGQGKPLSGQNITFNINGVFYNRLTDVNGTARLNINLQPGVYIITSTYNGCNIANTVKVNA